MASPSSTNGLRKFTLPTLTPPVGCPRTFPPVCVTRQGFAGSRPSLTSHRHSHRARDSLTSPATLGVVEEELGTGTSNRGLQPGALLRRKLVAPGADPSSDTLGRYANRHDLLSSYSKRRILKMTQHKSKLRKITRLFGAVILGVVLGLVLGSVPGCGQKKAEPPPLTEDLKAKIQQEDEAITAAEKAQSQLRP